MRSALEEHRRGNRACLFHLIHAVPGKIFRTSAIMRQGKTLEEVKK